MKHRILWIDNLKALLIFLVVLSHCLQINPLCLESNVYIYIISFFMPMFMFMSGFCCSESSVNVKKIKTRFVQLIIPFLSWTIISSFYRTDATFLSMILNPTKSLWFLWVLFWINVIHVVVHLVSEKVKIKSGYLSLVAVVALYGIYVLTNKTHLFSYDLITFHFVFYSAGFYARKHEFFRWIKPHIALGCLLLWAVLGSGGQSGNIPVLSVTVTNILVRKGILYIVPFTACLGMIPLFMDMINRKVPYFTNMGGVHWPCMQFISTLFTCIGLSFRRNMHISTIGMSYCFR